MKNFSYLLLVLVSSLFLNGCSKTENDSVTPPPDKRLSFELNIWDYSTNHYFVDSVYADTSAALNLYSKYYANLFPQAEQEYIVTRIEIWKSIITTIPDPKERMANAYINLPSRNPNLDLYPASYKDFRVDPIPGEIETGPFVLLTQGVDYTFNDKTGEISFRTPIQQDDAIAVAFSRRGTSEVYGEFTDEVPDTLVTQRIVLKLVKPRRLIPLYKKAWQLQLKNIYSLNARNIQKDGFQLNILYSNPDLFPEPQNEYKGNKLLAGFGLDKYDNSLNLNPDGLFDFVPGITIMPAEGEIRFPYLQPFGRQIPKIFQDDGIKSNEIYDTLKTFARQAPAKFKLVGKYNAGD